MVYKIYISASDDNQHYLTGTQRAVSAINEIALTALPLDDTPISDSQRLRLARMMIQEAKIFIGLYDNTYGKVPAGETQSFEELEYQEAVAAGKSILIFMHEDAYKNADERQKAFLQHVLQKQVVTRFTDESDLIAKIKLAVDNYRATAPHRRRIRPAPPNFQENLPGLTMQEQDAGDRDLNEAVIDPDDPDFETLVARALQLAEDSIEDIVRRALELHSAQQQVTDEPSEDYDNKITVSPLWGEPIRRSQFQSDIFMIMPFREPFDVLYTDVIRPLAADLNMTIKRGDEFASTRGAIMQEVWAALNACQLVIAETTLVNANVYYELGIAHTLGKPVILLTQTKDIEEIPFDIRGLRFIIYEDTIAGSQALEKQLRDTIVWIMNDLEEQGMTPEDVDSTPDT